MTAQVQIDVVANDKASGKLKAIANGFANIGQQVTALLTSQGIQNLVSNIVTFGKEAVKATVSYHNELQRLSQISGTTIEDTARLVQVLDDFRISTSELTPALNAMRQNGLAPTVETLARLSDEYNALETTQQKNAFLADNFGRAWQKMPGIMSKGGDAIREMAASVDESLIPTEEAIKKTQEYQIATDNLSEAWEAFKMEIGEGVIPVLTDLVNSMLDASRAQEIFVESHGYLYNASTQLNPKIREEYEAALAAARAEREHADALKTVASGAGAATDAIDELKTSSDNLSKLKFILDFQFNAGKFEEDKERILTEMEELRDRILELRAQIAGGNAEDSAPEDLAALEDQLRGLTSELEKSKQAFELWQKQAVYSMLQTKLAADGLSDAEFAALLKIGEDMGLISPEVAAQAQEALDMVNDALADVEPGDLEAAADAMAGLADASNDMKPLKLPSMKAADAQGMERIAKAINSMRSQEVKIINQELKEIFALPDEKTITVNVNYNSSGTPPDTGRAGGGSFTVPMGFPNDSYMMGLTSGEHVSVTTPGQAAMGGGAGVQNNYYYGAKILLEQGQEGEILSSLLE